MILQNSLANFSFLTLLGSMILYWIETSFTDPLPSFSANNNKKGGSKERQKGNGDVILAGIGLDGGELKKTAKDTSNPIWNSQNRNAVSPAKYGVIISNILLALLLIVRWKESGHFPLSNLYESLMFLSWCFTSLHLYIDFYASGSMLYIKKQVKGSELQPGTSVENSGEFYRKMIGAITTPSALLTNAFATFTLPKEMQEAAPLVPALQSNWLMMHVTVMILSYAALILGSLLSIAFLIVTFDFTKANKANKAKSENITNFNKNDNASTATIEGQLAMSPRGPSIEEGQLSNTQKPMIQPMNQPIAVVLDNLSYRILGIGFPLLTIGILSGAVWANEAWGSYWSWDPKETWALLTWLIFAIYLHTRLSKGWEGKKPAMIASFGFVVVWICYLGVNLIGEGLHSYGWILKS